MLGFDQPHRNHETMHETQTRLSSFFAHLPVRSPTPHLYAIYTLYFETLAFARPLREKLSEKTPFAKAFLAAGALAVTASSSGATASGTPPGCVSIASRLPPPPPPFVFPVVFWLQAVSLHYNNRKSMPWSISVGMV